MPNLFNYEYLDTYSFDILHADAIYTEYKPELISGKRDYIIQIDQLGIIFRLLNKKTGIIESVISLDYRKYYEQEFYEVKYTNSSEKQQGHMDYLFELVTHEFKYHLISDEQHTKPGSMDFWISLNKRKKYELFIFNIETGHKRRYSNYPIKKIWGFDIEGDVSVKNEIFERMWMERMITKEMYEFFVEHIPKIERLSDLFAKQKKI